MSFDMCKYRTSQWNWSWPVEHGVNLWRRLVYGADDCFAACSELLEARDDTLSHERVKTWRWFVTEQQRRVCQSLTNGQTQLCSLIQSLTKSTQPRTVYFYAIRDSQLRLLQPHCRRHAAPTKAQVRLHWTAWRSNLSTVGNCSQTETVWIRMTLSFPSNFIPSSTVVLAIVLAIKAILKTSVDDDDDNNDW